MYKYKPIVESPIIVEDRNWLNDPRGGLVEIVRGDNKWDDHACEERPFIFGQVYCTKVNPRVIKGFHLHEKQTDRIFLLKGSVRFVGLMFECSVEHGNPRITNPNFTVVSGQHTLLDLIVLSSSPRVITIPPGIWHAFQNVGTEEALVINVPDISYNYEKPDETRMDPHDSIVAFPWNFCVDG